MPQDPSTLLAQLIEFGYSPDPTLPLPAVWQTALDAVRRVRGSREERLAAFAASTEKHPLGYAMMVQVLSARPVQEDRDRGYRNVRSAADALSSPPVLDWCVHDLFSRPSLNLLVGDPGSKKTLLALDLAVCLALGLPWLGHQVTACPVLLVDEETGLPRLWSRLNSALLAHKAGPQTPLHFMSLPGYNLRDPQEAEDLGRKAQSVGAGLVVIDALADVIRGGDENSVLSVQPVFNNLRRLSEVCRVAVLVLHHTNKMGGFRGSSSISAGVDLMLSIESPAASPLIHLSPLKGRDVLPLPFSARAHFEPERFWLSASEEQPSPNIATGLNPSAIDVLRFLAESQLATTPQIMARISDRSPSAIRQVVHELMVAGFIERVDGGARGKIATFQLSAKGRLHAN